MQSISQLQADLIRSISTKYFYKQERLLFQIMIAYGDRHLYQEFEDYETYKTEHNRLVVAMNNKSVLENRFTPAYLEKAS